MGMATQLGASNFGAILPPRRFNSDHNRPNGSKSPPERLLSGPAACSSPSSPAHSFSPRPIAGLIPRPPPRAEASPAILSSPENCRRSPVHSRYQAWPKLPPALTPPGGRRATGSSMRRWTRLASPARFHQALPAFLE